MRLLLLMLLIAGLGYLGLEGWSQMHSVRATPETGGDGTQLGPGVAKGADESAGIKQDSDSDIVVFAGTGDADLDSRWRSALLSGGLERVERGSDLATKLVPGTGGHFAFLVANALAAADAVSATLAQASDALVDKRVPRAGALISAAVGELLGKNRPQAALSALGSTNGLLSAPDASRRVEQLIEATRRFGGDEARVVYLSKLVDGLTRGQDFWGSSRQVAAVSSAYKELTAVLRRTVFTHSGRWRSREHRVSRNETLGGICRRYSKELQLPVSVGLVQMINGIPSPEKMRADITLRIPTSELQVVVEKSTHVMKVLLGSDVIIRLYQVGLGKQSCTPSGEFVIVEKQENPDWYPPSTSDQAGAGRIPHGDPRNPLGRYFIKLRHPEYSGLGIHGTKDQSSVGKNMSLGCVRLRNDDMVDAFLLLPRNIKVRIR